MMNIECPYCGEETWVEFIHAFDKCSDTDEFDCEKCGKTFEITEHIDYTAQKLKADRED